TPVFVDVHPDTMNFDERDAARKITPRTRAMAPIHYAGVGCAMDELMELARKHEITVIEDNAHGFLGEYRGRRLGTIGPMGALSFHETKNFTCGEGGALIVNDPKYVERAEILREKGTNRSRFFRGQVDKYTWVDIGSSYVVSDVLAAFLYGQLEQWRGIQEKRGRVWNRYWTELEDWCAANGVVRPHVPADRVQTYHMFYLMMPTPDAHDRFIAFLKERRIVSVFHYQPLHVSTMGRRYGGAPGDCPVTEDVAERLVRLPFFTDMTEDEQTRVVAAVQAFKA
ncbi:MAG: dTDP-4-amino-4,6-dideoxygalactose transaminase, partial [Planctomycetia bacterium]